jgi:hypothetical protein
VTQAHYKFWVYKVISIIISKIYIDKEIQPKT